LGSPNWDSKTSVSVVFIAAVAIWFMSNSNKSGQRAVVQHK
jgi:hypothetical protein